MGRVMDLFFARRIAAEEAAEAKRLTSVEELEGGAGAMHRLAAKARAVDEV